MKKSLLLLLLSALVLAACDDDDGSKADCEIGETRTGTIVCGLNGEGVLLEACQDGMWVDSDICSGTDVCVNDATQLGATVCNDTGVYVQLCAQGAWGDTTECTVTAMDCTPDATQLGSTICGFNDEGFFVQVCSATGVWEDSAECSGTDECENGDRQEGVTPCNDTGVIYQDCTGGQWVDSAECTVGGCVNDATRVGTDVCGINDEGFFIELCAGGMWTLTTDCSGTDICLNGERQEGTTVCHTTGVLYQDCTGGQWADSADCTVGGCMEDATRVGTSPCGLNDEGFFIQLCDNVGVWNNTAECTGTDICHNGDTDAESCGDGHGTQDLLCASGQWTPDGPCVCEATYHFDGTTCARDITVVWCGIMSPQGYVGDAGTPETIYAQIYGTVDGAQVTNSGVEIPSIDARVCYDDNGTEVCTEAVYNAFCLNCGNNDEYMAPLSFDATGSYDYYYTFSGDSGATWTECESPYTADITGAAPVVFPENGDFEAWTAGAADQWVDQDTGISVAEETSIVHGGTSSAAVTVNTDVQGDTDYTRTISVTAGTTYQVSVWVYHPAGTHVRIALSHDGSYSTFSNPTTQDSWQLVTGSFTPTSATATVGIRFYDITGFVPGELVYIDDFSVAAQ